MTLRPHPPLADWYSSEEERLRRVRAWFDQTAEHYDWIGQTMSFGSGHLYRRQVLGRAGIRSGSRVLDVACGTGVLAEAATRLAGPAGRVVGLDPSRGMLARARRREIRHLTQGIAEALPFADGSFDLVTMGYALRHVADLETTFAEYRRVLAPGGRLLILEITRPRTRLSLALVRFWLGRVVPWFSGFGNRPARELMAYYWETVDACVPPETILAALAAAGFARPERRLSLGIFSEYVAEAGDTAQRGVA